jgi:hypothetical protein
VLKTADPAAGEAKTAACKSCHNFDAAGASGIGPGGTVKANSILAFCAVRSDRVSLFLFTNPRRAWRVLTPQKAYTHLL